MTASQAVHPTVPQQVAAAAAAEEWVQEPGRPDRRVASSLRGFIQQQEGLERPDGCGVEVADLLGQGHVELQSRLTMDQAHG